MSITAELLQLEVEGKLVRHEPKTAFRAKRRLYLAEPAVRKYNDPHSAVSILVGKAKILGALDRWVFGGRVYGDGKKGVFLRLSIRRRTTFGRLELPNQSTRVAYSVDLPKQIRWLLLICTQDAFWMKAMLGFHPWKTAKQYGISYFHLGFRSEAARSTIS